MKSLKLYPSVTASLLLAGSLTQAAPMVSLGDNVSLFIDSSAGVEHTENIFRTSSGQTAVNPADPNGPRIPVEEESDTALIIQPGIEVNFGKQGSAVSVLKLSYRMFQYFDYDNLNTELVKSSFTTRYDSGVYLATGEISYNEFGTSLAASPDNLTSILDPVVTERSETKIGGNLRYRFSDRLSVGGGLSYFGRSYDSSNLTDLDRFDVPFRVYYNIAPKLDAVVGYRYREVNNDSPTAPEYADHYFFVGLDGEIFNPLWRIELDLGLTDREWQNSIYDSDEAFTMRAKLTYNADANRSYFAIISRDYTVSPGNALTYIQDQLLVGMQYRLSEMWSVNAALALSKNDYQNVADRQEDIVFGQVGASYKPNEYLTVSGTFRYITVEGSGSSNAIDYDQQIVSVSAAIRY
jgi:hypothetical protein